MVSKVLETAMSRAAALPNGMQEQIGHDLLARIDSIERLESDVEAGLAELDAGLGEELDIEAVIQDARRQHGGF